MPIEMQQVFGNVITLLVIAGFGYLIYMKLTGHGVTFSFEFVKGLFRRH